MISEKKLTKPHNHLAALDGYRGIAAIFVAALHILQQTQHSVFQNNFAMAVDFFFVLSGFVIALSYGEKLSTSALGLGLFVKLRLIRLYPMLLVGALLGIAWRLFEHRFPVSSILTGGVAALLMLPLPRLGATGGDAYPVNGPGWSVTHELLVNVVFAAFARWLTGKSLWVCFAAAALVEIGYAVHVGRMDWAVAWADQPGAFIRAMAPFLLGVLIYRVLGARLRIVSDVWPILGAVVLALVLALPSFGLAYSVFCVFLVFPLLIITGSCQIRLPHLRAIMLLLGEISYPLYAINEPMARLMGAMFTRVRPNASGAVLAATVLAEIAFLLVVSLAIARIYDLPIRKWLRMKLITAA